MVKDIDNSRACKICGVFLAEGEQHEEFDYRVHPNAIGDIKRLREKLNTLPADERLYEMENYAVRRGLRRGATITVIEEGRPAAGQKKPDGGSIVSGKPGQQSGYVRLLDCYKWLRFKEAGEAEIDRQRESVPTQQSLT